MVPLPTRLPPLHRRLLEMVAITLRGETPPPLPPSLTPLARRERVLALLQRRLPGDPSPFALSTGVRNALLIEETRRVAEALALGGGKVMPLKGIDLCERVYQDPSLRPMHDIDLLVLPSGAREESMATLARAGWKALEPLRSGGVRNSVLLEGPPPVRAHLHLHWHLVNASYPLPYARRIDPMAMWGRGVPWGRVTEAARVPCPEDLCVYLCEHLVKHSCEDWIFAVDLLLAIGRMLPDPLRCREVAHAWGLERVCEAALRIVEALFPGMGVGVFHERFGIVPLTFSEHLFVRQVLSARRGPGVNWLLYLALCPTTTERVRQVWKGIFPGGDDLAALDGDEASVAGWRAHARRGVKAARVIRDALFGAP